MMQKGSTAILFFSRTAIDEAATKTFSTKGNLAVSQCLIDNVLNTLQASGLPIIQHYSDQQSGSNFGERLANSVESVYAQGYENVIIVGNDCPFISTILLLETSAQLEQKHLTLGPATDGGVYLIGIHKNIYQRDEFIQLPWQQSHLQTGWQQYAIQHDISISWLEEYFDIDEAEDFQKLLFVLPKSHLLRRQLLKIIQSRPVNHPTNKYSFLSKKYIHQLPLRAPPCHRLIA